MVDLFTPEGVHEKDSAQYDLQDAVGVRIYHVHAQQVKRVLTGSDGKTYTIGTIQIGNNHAYMAQNYDEFLYKGKMDNGAEFGYSIEVVSVTKDGATLRITKK